MKRSLSLCTLFVVSCFIHLAQAEIEFVFIFKERAFEQFGNMAPDGPADWAFGAGVEGDSQVTAATVTLPGSGTPVNLPGSDGAYEIDIQGFTTQSFLDNAYPNGNFSLSVTDNGSTQNLGPLSITGDGYPVIPQILNAQGLQFHDLSQNYTLMWNSFSGPDADDEVLLQIWDNALDETVVEEFLDPSTTSHLIPGGTLSANKNYEVGLVFINKTDSLVTPESKVGYFSTTDFQLSTFPQTPEEECVYISRGTFAEQTSAAIPTSFEYSFFAEAFGRGFSSATVIKPDTSEVPMQAQNPAFAPGEFELEEEYATAELRNAEYPEGNYSIRVVNNAVTTTHGPFALSGGTLPVTPGITNWTVAQTIDPDQNFTLTWVPFSNALAEASIEIDLQNNADFENQMDWDIVSNQNEVVIPSNFLQPNSTYSGEIIFINPAIPQQSSSGVIIDVVYEVITSFTIQTGGGGGGGGGPGGDFLVSRGITTSQTSSTIPTTGDFHFLAEANGSQFSAVTLIKPNGSEIIMPMDGPGEFDYEETFVTEGARDTAYPEGNYSARITDGGVTTTHGPMAQVGGVVPVIPGITNWTEAQSIDPDQDFTLSWTPFSNAGDEAQIEVEIWNTNNQNNKMDWILASDSGGLLLSSDFLQPNSTYSGEIIFINPAIFPTNSGNVILNSFYEVFTSFTFQTGDGEGGGGGSTGAIMTLFKRQKFLQTDSSTLGSDGWEAITFVNGNTSTITAAQIERPGGTDALFEFQPNLFVFLPMYGTQQEMDAEYPIGDYTFGLTENGIFTGYGPYTMPSDNYPAAPQVQNFNALQGFDPAQGQTIDWNAAPGIVSNINVAVRDFSNNLLWRENLDPSTTSAFIPPNTLSNNQNYDLEIRFSTPGTTNADPIVSLGHVSVTKIGIQTSSDGGGGGGGGPDVDGLFLVALKVTAYQQFNSFEPVLDGYEAFAQASDDDVEITAFSLLYPLGTVNVEEDDGDFEISGFYDSQAEMEAALPDGSYTFRVTQNGSTNEYGPYNVGGNSPAEIPYIINYAALQGYDTSQDISIQFNPFASATADDIIAIGLEISDDLGGDDPFFDFLETDETSYQIPGGTLQPNRIYQGLLIFGNISGTNETILTFSLAIQQSWNFKYPPILSMKVANLISGFPKAQLQNKRPTRIQGSSNGSFSPKVSM